MNKPNIIFLIQDQMQYKVLEESSGCLLPNLKNLIKDGIGFHQAHTCNAICSPARASLLTGTLPHIHGMVDCTHTVPSYRAEFNDSLDTITQAFQDEGYRVSYYGKWHIERSHELEKFGIQHYETEIKIPNFPVSIYDRITVENNGYMKKLLCGIFSEDSTHTEEYYIYDKAMSEIEETRKNQQPFCTFISTYAPHDPYCVPEEIYQRYTQTEFALPSNFYDNMKDKPVIYSRMREALKDLKKTDYQKAIRCYYSYCSLVDDQIGRLLTYLKEHNLYDDTLIVCMSDHGDLMGAHGLMMKSVEPFEEVYHIPLVIKLPNQKLAGSEMDFYITTNEIGPTVLELAGCRNLKGSHIGASMVPWITGEKKDKHFSFAEFFGQRFSYTQRIIWDDNMKYVFNAFAEDELYDLSIDPNELHNLSEHPFYQKKKQSLCNKMWELVKETGDESLVNAEYPILQIAVTGPGKKEQGSEYSIYNKQY